MDIIVDIKFKSTKTGGRMNPVSSGYKPHIRFDDIDYLTSGQLSFIAKDEVKPSESAIAEISLPSIEPFKNKLFIGMDFLFSEGNRTIGYGKILKVFNKELLKDE